MELVSIVIPYYNRGAFLRTTLESVWRQDYRPIELILVDNGSTDNSSDVVQAFALERSDNNFTIRVYEENKPGAAVARNKGLSEAHGKYVYFFDSDDEMSSDYISWAVNEMENEDADAIVSPTCMCWPDGSRTTRKYLKKLSVEGQVVSGQISTQSVFYKTMFIRSLHGWNEDFLLWNDWEMGIRLMLSNGKLKWASDKTFHLILQHDASITGRSFSASFSKILFAIENIFQLFEKQKSLSNTVWYSLALREAIVSGQLNNEGSHDLARQCFGLTRRITLGIFQRLFVKLLYYYTSLGGHGAWRIALFLLHS